MFYLTNCKGPFSPASKNNTIPYFIQEIETKLKLQNISRKGISRGQPYVKKIPQNKRWKGKI